MASFETIVIGRGLMGSAAARHLARSGQSVALIGPEEPKEKSSHGGVFGSHYDEGRITRTLSPDRDWAQLSNRSIQRYDEISQQGKISFFTPCGAVLAGPAGSNFVKQTKVCASRFDINTTVLSGNELATQLPALHFPKGTQAIWETGLAGHISPRKLVKAQCHAAARLGARILPHRVVEISTHTQRVSAILPDGSEITSRRAILACGAYSRDLVGLPVALNMQTFGRTICFAQISAATARKLADMPSVVWLPPGSAREFYVLPPIPYGDGNWYLKIGGDPDDLVLTSQKDLNQWFQSAGRCEVGEYLGDTLQKMLPDVPLQSLHFDSCVTSFSATEMPVIEAISDNLVLLTAGNGAGAKCSDELGRLAVARLLNDPEPFTDYKTDFRAS